MRWGGGLWAEGECAKACALQIHQVQLTIYLTEHRVGNQDRVVLAPVYITAISFFIVGIRNKIIL